MSATDHTAVALELIDSLHEWQEREGETDMTMLTAAIEALTHASIAAANQQWIANLIASLEMGFPDELFDADKRQVRIASTLNVIREGLGI